MDRQSRKWQNRRVAEVVQGAVTNLTTCLSFVVPTTGVGQSVRYRVMEEASFR